MEEFIWIDAMLVPNGPGLSDFKDIMVSGQFVAKVARYHSGRYEGLWTVLNVRDGDRPEYLQNRVFNEFELERKLRDYAVEQDIWPLSA